ncbi:MAG: endonuclease/exonuclease/phosphatase family protein [Planctomycetota bacterium]
MLLLCVCLPTLIGLAARLSWLAELATHFAWQYAIALPVCLVYCLATRRKRLAALAALCLLLNFRQLAPLYSSPTVTPVADTSSTQVDPLRVLTLNVLTANRKFDRVLELIRREDPEVVLLLEVDQPWVDAMAPLEASYPQHRHRVRSDNFGVAFYTRMPTRELQIREFGGGEVPSVVAEIDWQGEPLTIVGAHPLPPMSARQSAMRNNQLAAIGEFVSELPHAAVVLGDLNITPFSPHFRDLLESGDLRDSGRGYGWQPTWAGRFKWLGLPIDHVLYSSDLQVLDRRVGPHVGSDHRPVLVDFKRIGGK